MSPRLIWILSCLWCLVTPAWASTVIISYGGGASPTQSPVPWSLVGSSSNVIAGSYVDGTHTVWRIEDTGVPNGTNSKTAGLYYEKLFTPVQRDSMHQQGWSLGATIKLPSNEPNSGLMWETDSSSWLGFAYNFPVAAGETAHRAVFAFLFGRAANGTTNVQVYGGGSAGLRNVSGDYHEYLIAFNPATQKASYYIDGDFIMEFGGMTSTSTGDSRLYWGDNLNQGTQGKHRAMYFESVVFSTVPEPSRVLLIILAAGALLICRRHRNT